MIENIHIGSNDLTQKENYAEKIATKTHILENGHKKLEDAYKNHNTAELPSAFLVNSQASSKAIGNRATEQAPMITRTAKSAPVL